MALKAGIVGLPNVGKSTLFNAVSTSAKAQASNYRFCTIEPNIGLVDVPDERLNKLAELVQPERIVPTQIEIVDIAGIVKGASQGEGLGNKFLANIREVDAIAHVVRCFENDDIVHVAGKVHPLDDIETINTELALADLETADKGLQRAEKAAKGGDKEALRAREVFRRVRDGLNQGRAARAQGLDEQERLIVRELQLLTMKPVLYIANVSEGGFHDNPLLAAVEALALK